MTKQEEIKTLQSLKGDTYFAEYFKSDIDTMCQNIRNDLPIEFGTFFSIWSVTLDSERNEFRNKMTSLVSKAIVLAHDPEMEKIFEDAIGKMELIKVKRENNIPLTNAEIDYLINAAENNK